MEKSEFVKNDERRGSEFVVADPNEIEDVSLTGLDFENIEDLI